MILCCRKAQSSALLTLFHCLRSEAKTGFDETRALRIVIEAAEQCGRGDIPIIEEMLSPEECVGRFSDHYTLFVADREGADAKAG